MIGVAGMQYFKKYIFVLLVLLAIYTLMGCGDDKSNSTEPLIKGEPPFAFTQEIIDEGKGLFLGKGTCFACHGFEGKGDGPAGFAFNPKPTNFTDTAWAGTKTLDDLMNVLKNGSPGSAMVPFIGTPGSIITEDEGWKMIAYIVSLTSSE